LLSLHSKIHPTIHHQHYIVVAQRHFWLKLSVRHVSQKKAHKHAGLAGVGFITDSALAKLLRKMKEESMLADDDDAITPQPIMQSHSYHNSQLTN